VSFPEPHPGLVIRYAYLWKRESDEGREEGRFVWPGPDLRPVPGRDESTVLYGALPPKFFAHVRDRFLARVERDKAARVNGVSDSGRVSIAGVP
jgi:hypothetical protein